MNGTSHAGPTIAPGDLLEQMRHNVQILNGAELTHLFLELNLSFVKHR